MAMNSGNLQHSLELGIAFIIGRENRDYSPEYSQIFEEKTSTKNKEEILLRSGMGTAYQVGEGAATPMDGMSDEWIKTLVHQTFKLGFEITEEAVEDNQYESLVSDASKELVRAFRHTKEIRAAAHFNNATSILRPYLGGDGKALLASDHPLANGNTFSNILAGMQLSESSFEQCKNMIGTAVDERGNRIMLKPRQLITSIYNSWVAERLMMSDYRPGTNNNDVNAIKSTGFIKKPPVILSYLTDQDAWFVQTDQPKGLMHYKRRAFTPKSKRDENTGSYFGFASERYSFGHADPRCVFGSMG